MTELLLDGLGFPESGRWHDGRLWLCNWGTGDVLAVDTAGDTAGRAEVAAHIDTTIPFSIDWLPDGRMLVVSGQEALVLRQEPDGTLVTHADLANLGSTFNEIVVAPDGTAFVNGSNIVRISPDGTATEVATDIAFGNGMAITADGSTLIVAESHANQLTAFDISVDGLANRRVWAHCGDGFPDGICLDASGAVWYADVPNKRCVRVAEGGEVLQSVDVDRGAFSCMLGGTDGMTLFALTAQWRGMDHMFDDDRTGQVVMARVDVSHAGRP